MSEQETTSSRHSKEMVVKSNELIQAGYTLSLIEQRMILLSIVQARETGTGISAADHLTISAAAYAKQFDVSREAAYMALKEAAGSLFDRQVTLHDIDPDSGKSRRRVTRWVSEVAYVEDMARVKLIFAPAVVPHITQLERNFTAYELEQVSALRSAYAVRLYELLIQWRATGETPVIAVQRFRMQMGVQAHELLAMSDFKKRVLDLGVSQINAHTDIWVEYEQLKSGRSITGFRFRFRPKHKDLMDARDVTPASASGQPRKAAALQGLAGIERKLLRDLQPVCADLTEAGVLAEASRLGVSAFDYLQQRVQALPAEVRAQLYPQAREAHPQTMLF